MVETQNSNHEEQKHEAKKKKCYSVCFGADDCSCPSAYSLLVPKLQLGNATRKLLLPVLILEARASKTKVTKLELSNQTQDILSGMSEKDKELVRKTKGGDLIMFHHGWGTGIRNISF